MANHPAAAAANDESAAVLNADLLQKFAALAGLVALLIVFSLIARNFCTVDNFINICRQTTTIALAGIGVTFVIITGGIDLSIGSVLAMSGVVAGMLVKNWGWNVYASFLVGMLAGVFIGFLNGGMVNFLRLPPFIATLGTMMIARGLALLVTNARSIPGLPETFGDIGNAAAGTTYRIDARGIEVVAFPGIPYAVILMVVLAAAFHYILSCTKLGRYIYAVGSNEEATRLSGINVVKVKFSAYMICGGFAALAGIVTMSRLVTVQPTAGVAFEMDAIASAVIGGTSLMGGMGSISGTIIGAFIIGVLRNGLNMFGVQGFVQQILIGLVIILAVSVDQLRNRKKT
ncbi:MAG: ABC transporter permease [Planctomycetota bacterium]|jgi:ribose transport system permease protein|nr:ABC transporter permease [Planctomycetota bacterium]